MQGVDAIEGKWEMSHVSSHIWTETAPASGEARRPETEEASMLGRRKEGDLGGKKKVTKKRV